MRARGLLLSALLLVPGCSRPPDRLRVALSSAPLSLDPYASNEWASFAVHANVYQHLVTTDAALRVQPDLARRWLNPDDLTWDFELDPAARFRDGRPVTADDVVESLQRARQSDWKGNLTSVSRMEARGPDRVILHTREPVPALLRTIVGLAIVPRGATQLDGHPQGSGRYEVASRRGADVTLVRVGSGPPAIREAEFTAIADPAERVRAVTAGEVDLATDIPPASVSALRRLATVQVLESPGLRQVFLGFDTAREATPKVDGPRNPFRDRRVRQAVQLAIDRARLLTVALDGRGEVATQMVPRTAFGFDPTRTPPAYDPERARALLAEAGWPQGFTVTLDSPKGVYVADEAMSRYVADALAAVGIRVRVNSLEKQRFFQTLAAHDTSFYLMAWNCLSNDGQEVFDFILHGAGTRVGLGSENAGGYQDAELDRLIEAAGREMDPGNRLELLRKAGARAEEDVATVPLLTPSTIYALRKPWSWTPRPDRRITLDEIEIR